MKTTGFNLNERLTLTLSELQDENNTTLKDAIESMTDSILLLAKQKTANLEQGEYLEISLRLDAMARVSILFSEAKDKTVNLNNN